MVVVGIGFTSLTLVAVALLWISQRKLPDTSSTSQPSAPQSTIKQFANNPVQKPLATKRLLIGQWIAVQALFGVTQIWNFYADEQVETTFGDGFLRGRYSWIDEENVEVFWINSMESDKTIRYRIVFRGDNGQTIEICGPSGDYRAYRRVK
jgi:hypothetical protein